MPHVMFVVISTSSMPRLVFFIPLVVPEFAEGHWVVAGVFASNLLKQLMQPVGERQDARLVRDPVAGARAQAVAILGGGDARRPIPLSLRRLLLHIQA